MEIGRGAERKRKEAMHQKEKRVKEEEHPWDITKKGVIDGKGSLGRKITLESRREEPDV